MLTKDLLRFGVAGDEIRPKLLKATPAISELADKLLAHWRDGVGTTLGSMEEAAVPILHGTRSLHVAKGLQKLIVDGCTFRDAASCAALRESALAASARLLRTPAMEPDAHRAAVAVQVGSTAEALADGLYADLPAAAILEQACPLDADDLIARYNLAQCQGLLLTAHELTVTLHDSDTGMRRKLLKALRFQRLLAEVKPLGSTLSLNISGPGSVLDQASRYGLNLALFLPALACAKHWEATAWVTPGRERAPLRLLLSDGLGLVGDSRFLGFIPEEIRTLEAEVRRKLPEWKLEEPQLLPLPNGELVVPDLQLRRPDGRVVTVELFHRWHATALERRLAQLTAGLMPNLVLGVDRAVAKRLPALEAHPAFARGFLFNDLPTVRGLCTALQKD